MQEIVAAHDEADRKEHLADIMSDYQQRLTATEADAYLGLRKGSVAKAWRRGEIEPYVLPNRPKRPFFTPLMLAEWLDTYCRPKAQRIPG